jgi:PilZ domain-containing protein
VTEQRKHQRFDLRLPFQIVGSGKAVKITGETKNVSSAGVLFTSETPVAIGEPIEYVITFPKAPGSRSEVRLRCVGKVVREDTELAFAATLERYEFQRQSA